MGIEKKLVPLGIWFAILSGTIMPLNGLLLSKLIINMSILFNLILKNLENSDLYLETCLSIKIYIILYILLGLFSWIVSYL